MSFFQYNLNIFHFLSKIEINAPEINYFLGYSKLAHSLTRYFQEDFNMAKKAQDKISNPIFTRSITFETDHAQKCHERYFEKASQALFSIEVVLNVISKQNENIDINEVFNLCHSYIKNTDKELNAVIEQINELLRKDKNNIEDITKTLTYSNQKSYKVEISSPKQIQLLNLISKLDSLIQLIDIAWMSGILDSGQRVESIYQWRRQVNAACTRIVTLEKNVRIKMNKNTDNNDNDDNSSKNEEESSSTTISTQGD